MAAPTLVTGLTDWELFEGSPSFTSIGGGTGAGTTTEVFRQGSQSAGRKAGSTGQFGFATTVTAVDFTVSERYLWVWWMILYSPNQLATRVNGGVAIFLGTGGTTNYNEYYVGGSDSAPDGRPVQAGRWYRSVLDLNQASASNTGGSGATLSNIDRLGITVNYTSTPSGNLFHFYIDGAQYGTGFHFHGGSASDPITLADIEAYTETSARAWGFCEEVQGTYLSNGEWWVGDGSNPTYFEDDGQILLFRPQEYETSTRVGSALSSNTNNFFIDGPNCDFLLTNTVIKTLSDDDAERWRLQYSGPETLFLDGCFFVKAAGIVLGNAAEINNCLFENCQAIAPTGADFTGATIKNYTGTQGAMTWSSTSVIEGCKFLNNSNAIQFPAGSGLSINFDNLYFEGNTYDVRYVGTGDLVIYNLNGSNASTEQHPGGGTVTFITAASHILTGLAQNTEVTYMEVDSFSNVLFHVEDVDSTGQTQFDYDAGSGGPGAADILIHHVDYVPILFKNVPLTLEGGFIPVFQQLDRIYSNP